MAEIRTQALLFVGNALYNYYYLYRQLIDSLLERTRNPNVDFINNRQLLHVAARNRGFRTG